MNGGRGFLWSRPEVKPFFESAADNGTDQLCSAPQENSTLNQSQLWLIVLQQPQADPGAEGEVRLSLFVWNIIIMTSLSNTRKGCENGDFRLVNFPLDNPLTLLCLADSQISCWRENISKINFQFAPTILRSYWSKVSWYTSMLWNRKQESP